MDDCDEPHPETPEVLNFHQKIINYSGLNLVKLNTKSNDYYFRTQNQDSTYNLTTQINVGGFPNNRRNYNIQVNFNNGLTTRLQNGRILRPYSKASDGKILEFLLLNVLNWISEFNTTNGYPEDFLYLKNSQLSFFTHTLWGKKSPGKLSVNDTLETQDGLVGFFNMVMCYRLSSIILLFDMLPFENSVYGNPMLNFWFDEFKEIPIVLNHLTKIIEVLNVVSKEYFDAYVVGGMDNINPDLEMVKENSFYNDFLSSIMNLTGLQRTDLKTLYNGITLQNTHQEQRGGVNLTEMTGRDTIYEPPSYSCKSTKYSEIIIMKKILKYITERTGRNQDVLDEIFSDKRMTPELLEIVGRFIFHLQEVNMRGGASMPGVSAMGLAALTTITGETSGFVPVLISSFFLFKKWGTYDFNNKKKLAMEILIKQKRAYMIYCIMRIQAQNIYDFTNTYNHFAFIANDVMHSSATELKTIAFLGRNSYTILFHLLQYFMGNDDLSNTWNIPLIMATTANNRFSWGKDFALEFVTQRDNNDVKVIPFIESTKKIKETDALLEYEFIYCSPDCEIVLPNGITFEMVKGWAFECLHHGFGWPTRGRFEDETIENQRLRLDRFGKKFFSRRQDIGDVDRDPNLSKFTLTLNLQRTKTMDEYNNTTHNDIQHTRVKNVLLNCVRTIQDEEINRPRVPNFPLPITNTFLDYVKDIFENNNKFTRGATRKKQKKKKHSKQKKKKHSKQKKKKSTKSLP